MMQFLKDIRFVKSPSLSDSQFFNTEKDHVRTERRHKKKKTWQELGPLGRLVRKQSIITSSSLIPQPYQQCSQCPIIILSAPSSSLIMLQLLRQQPGGNVKRRRRSYGGELDMKCCMVGGHTVCKGKFNSQYDWLQQMGEAFMRQIMVVAAH